MATDRFHKAAKDGLLDVLKETTKRDSNSRDEMGMTPTLYAAFNGHLDALRLLCGRGGDPDKADYFGNTALHLAAAQGHKSIVMFLVNFGVNIYAMNIDERTPQELAGMHSKDEILRYLDGIAAKLEATDKKKAKGMKEKAKKNAEKIIKEFNKRQNKSESALKSKRLFKEHKPSVINTLKSRIKSGSTSNLTNIGNVPPRNSFSAIVSGGTMSRNVTSTVQKKALANKFKSAIADDDFKISEIEDGKRSVRSIRGFRRDSEVMYGGTLDAPKRGRLDDVFNEAEEHNIFPHSNLTRSISQPDFMHELNNNEDNISQEPASIFVRPGIGSLAFRKSITNTLQAMTMVDAAIEDSSIGSAGSLAVRQRQFTSFVDDLSESESSEEENPNYALERFLTAWELGEYLPKFVEQKIDLNTLMILTETDLKSLNLPLGPYRKLVNAISERKSALENPGEVTDSAL